MKSPLYLLAVATVSAPLFMGQAALDGAYQKGGGGFGCSNNDAALATNQNAVDPVTPEVPENTDTEVTTQSDSCPAAPDPLNPSADDSCQDRDFYASVKGNDWHEEITSFFGRPVDDTCAGECGGTGDHTPWTLSVKLSGTPFGDGKAYSFSFMKDEFKDKVRYLEVARDPASVDGCPLEEKAEPCWKTCDGTCLPIEDVIKDEKVLEKEAKDLLVSYANDVCKIGLKAEDLDDDGDMGEKIRVAAENATFKDVLYCAEGILLTGTQVLDWVDTVTRLGLMKDETGKDYTQDQIWNCAKKNWFKADKPAPTPP